MSHAEQNRFFNKQKEILMICRIFCSRLMMKQRGDYPDFKRTNRIGGTENVQKLKYKNELNACRSETVRLP